MKQRGKLFNLRVTDYLQKIMAVLLVLIALGYKSNAKSFLSCLLFLIFSPFKCRTLTKKNKVKLHQKNTA